MDPDANVGRALGGRYQITERLGSGGMGIVYRGERIGLGRAVAIKFLQASIAGHPDSLKRFQTEARAASRLSHPNCTAVIDFGVEDGSPYLVMDFVTGVTLRDLIEAGRVAPARAVHIGRQLLAGLAHAHGHEIVHRDIKPENIVLTETTGVGDQVRILDFGLAKLTDSSSSLTTGFAVGTPSYMAPEQSVGDSVDARTDVYSVGVLLFELIAGRKPYVGKDGLETIRMHCDAPIPTLPGVSKALGAAITKALAKRRIDRHANAAAFAAALEATPEARMAARPPPGAIDVSRTRLDVPPRRRRRSGLVIAVVLLVVGVGGVVGLTFALSHDGNANASDANAASPGTPGAVSTPAAPATPTRLAEAPREPVAPAASKSSAPTPKPTEAPHLASEPPPVDRLAAIRQLVAAGHGEAAIQRLVTWRTSNPRDAEAAFLLGHLYFAKLWWNDGMHAYEAALAQDPSLQRDPTLIRDLVHSLESDHFYGRAAAQLVSIGAPAVPILEDAMKSDPTINVRRRAAALVERLRR